MPVNFIFFYFSPVCPGKRLPRNLSFPGAFFCSLILIFSLCFLSLLKAGAAEHSVPTVLHFPDFSIINIYDHDPAAFTQGLCFVDGFLYEGTGLYGHSTLRRGLLSGKNLLIRRLPGELFGEGITVWQDRIIQLTWKSGIGLVWEKKNMRPRGTIHYPTQGWGLTHDKQWLIMSDGSNFLYFLDPDTFRLDHKLAVTDQERPVTLLNELEFVKGEIWANIWQDNRIARINPHSGQVVGWLDMAPLAGLAEPGGQDDVLNGIAYDSGNDRIFVTGKHWNKLFEIRLKTFKDAAER